MPKRLSTTPKSLEGLYTRLEEIVLANSGEDEFEEILKLIVVKIWLEQNSQNKLNFSRETLNNYLKQINILWPGVLNSQSIEISEEQTASCLLLLQEYSLLGQGFDAIDALFEFIISKKKKGAKGQFFTPRYIVDLCVSLLNPINGEVVLDPAAGSSSFLFHAAQHIKKGLLEEDAPDYKLFAFDIDDKAVRISRLLMHVANTPNYKIYRTNSLLTQSAQISLFNNECDRDDITTVEDYLRINKITDKVDIILTNPPFAGEITENDLLDSYEVAKGKHRIERDVLFIERCIKLLKPKGRMAIILPDNIFGGKGNADLREWILREARIWAVIGLPRNTFMPHTPVKTSILILQKRQGKITHDEDVFFGISEKSGKDSRGNYLYNSEEHDMDNLDHDLNEIKESFINFIRQQGGF